MSNQGKSYDIIADGFAKMRDSFNTEKKYIDALLQHLPKKSHILDVGCGSGFPIAAYLIEQGFNVTGIDGSEELLNIAKSKCPKMRGLYGDVRTIALNETFDGIVEWWCLFHIPKPDHEKMIYRFSKWPMRKHVRVILNRYSKTFLILLLHCYHTSIQNQCLKKMPYRLKERHYIRILTNRGKVTFPLSRNI